MGYDTDIGIGAGVTVEFIKDVRFSIKVRINFDY